MWRLTFAGLAAHRIRYALTTLSVLLAVAFMAGTLVLTDTVGRTFDGLFADSYRNTAAVVRAAQAYEPPLNFSSQRRQIDADVADLVRRVPGVTDVAVQISGYAQLVSRSGKAIGDPGTGAPTLGETWDGGAMSPYRMVAGGRPPSAADEVVIDKHSADVGHLRVGDRVTVLTKRAPASYEITGIVRWQTADSPLGASITLFPQATAEKVLGSPGKVDEIDVAAAPGVTQAVLADRLKATLSDPTLDVSTGAAITKENQKSLHQLLGFFNAFLLAFALIAMFVGSFLIFNTFSIVVAQRLRELALLRAVGASRRQIAASVLGEALAVGLIASAAGLLAGIGLAVALRAMLAALGFDIPSTGLVVAPRTIVVSILTGTVVTLLASVTPARRAATVAPVAAMRGVSSGREPRLLRRAVLGGGVLGVGVVALLVGLFADVPRAIVVVGAGAATSFVGLAMLGPLLTKPLGRVVDALLRWRGPVGRLAATNVTRNPRRTSATAAALMVGVAVVALMTVMASSIKASVNSVVDATMRADLVVNSGGQPGGQVGFSASLQQKLASLPQVASSTGVRAGPVQVFGSSLTVLAADPRAIGNLFDVGVTSGDLASLSPTGIAVSADAARSHHLAVGNVVQVTFPTTGAHQFRVQAIYKARDLAGDYLLSRSAAATNFSSQLDFQVYVKLASGVSVESGKSAATAVVADYPNAKIMDRQEYKQAQLAQIDQLLNLVYGLLGLALLIALLGIANTLSLAIHERTRELGLLRAVGMTRSQLRTTIRYEAVVVALLGALEGLVAGIVLGWAMVAALGDSGVSVLSVPLVPLLVLTLIAALAGIVAAIAPGRLAARMNVLAAITTE